MIYFLRKDYFQKLNDISTEISYFKAGSYSGNFDLEVAKDKDIMLQKYVPMPTNRKKRCKLYKITKSKALFCKNENLINIQNNICRSNKKEELRKILLSKNIA